MDQVVFVDADDTLWENTRYFHQVLDAWGRLMTGLGIDSEAALATLERCEERNIPLTGYGTDPFLDSVREAWAELVPAASSGQRDGFEDFVDRASRRLRDHSIELLAGVEEGLAHLAAERCVVVLTKGQDDEQRAKLERSGLARHFTGIRVVDRKDRETYLRACDDFDVAPAAAWMVGNSPRSDINPARLEGLRTVLVAHDAPWHHEVEPLVAEGPATLHAATFADVPELILRGCRL